MSKEVLAVVAGKEITEEQLNTFIQGLPREQQMYASHPQFRKQCIDQLTSIYMFAALGEEEKLDETEEFKKIIESAKIDVLAQLAMRKALEGITVSEEEAKEYYEDNKQQFAKGATVSAKHILVKEEEDCNKILEAITSGEKSFEDAAKESSTCPSGQQGGNLGEFGRGQMVKEFEDAAFEAEIGAVVGPVKTQFGFHLIKVEAKNEAAETPYEEVKTQIEKQLLTGKQNEAYAAKVKELTAKYLEK